jgi:four helix bundle protein
MRRAAVSIPTNLAEGSGRSTNRDFARFVSNAIGSASELDYQLLLARDLGFIDREVAELAKTKVAEVRRMLSALRRNLVDTKWVTGGV